jgi:SAM-dependent methyltransferase
MQGDRTAWLRAFYDDEAVDYDATRGGELRGALAAAAFAELLGPSSLLAGPAVEVGAGTGVVAGALRRQGYQVLAADLSLGMLRRAAPRLPGRVVQCDARALPLADGSCGAVVLSWVLHVVDDPFALVDEAARVIGPGGRLVTTVNKNASSRAVEPGAHRAAVARPVTDDPQALAAQAARLGLEPVGRTSYVAQGQRGAPTYDVMAWQKPARAPGRR